MSVALIHVIYVRNGMTRFQYIIVPEYTGKGRHVGDYPDVASAYAAAVAKGAPYVYLHHPDDFPLKMAHAADTCGMAWCS